MKKGLLIIIVIISLIMLSGCGTKADNLIEDESSTLEIIEENSVVYSSEDWKNTGIKDDLLMADLSEELSKDFDQIKTEIEIFDGNGRGNYVEVKGFIKKGCDLEINAIDQEDTDCQAVLRIYSTDLEELKGAMNSVEKRLLTWELENYYGEKLIEVKGDDFTLKHAPKTVMLSNEHLHKEYFYILANNAIVKADIVLWSGHKDANIDQFHEVLLDFVK